MQDAINKEILMLNKLKSQAQKAGIEVIAGIVGISTGHLHKLIYKPKQYRLTNKMKNRIIESGVIEKRFVQKIPKYKLKELEKEKKLSAKKAKNLEKASIKESKKTRKFKRIKPGDAVSAVEMEKF